MYICLDCGYVFSDPTTYIETHALDSPPYEEWKGCPKCAGAYEKTFPCEVCGKWIDGEYIELKDGATICDDCYKIKNIE